MEMLYSPSSPSSAASSDSIPSLNDPGASSEGDACPNVSSSSTLVGVDDDDVVGGDDGSGASHDEPSKDSILTLLGMRFLPTTPNAHHIPSPITSMVGQSSTPVTFAGASPSTSGGHSLSSTFLAPSPLTPGSSSLGLPTSFANPAMSGMSGTSSTGAFPYYSTSLLSPSSSSPPAVYTPPSPTMPSASAYHHQHQHHHQHHQYQQPQHLQYQSSSSSYPLTSQLLYPQQPQPQQQYQQPQQYQIVPQQQSYQQQQQYQPQQHSSSGSFGFLPSQQLYIQAHLNSDAAGDHHSFVEPLGVGHKRKADLALTDSTLHHQHHHQHQPYQQQLHNSGELTVAPHRRDHDGYGGHHHHNHHHHGQQYQHQHNGGHHHHHHQQQQPHHHQQQLVVAAKAKKRRVRKTWTERFQQLKEFKQRFGHCKVPKGWSEDPKLARWVCNMRQSKRMGKMKEERVRKLEELGFLWRCEQTGKVIWEEMIEKLKAFQARHGHCRVPVEWPEDPQLSAWVVYVRQRNRANNLSQEKVKELDAIQFVWTDVSTAAAASNGSTAATTSNAQRRSDPGEADPGRPELLY